MEIVIVSPGLATGPETLSQRSLGGSETAAVMMAKELRKLGHLVTIFCNLPPAGRPDHFKSGDQSEDGVRWVSLEQYGPFITNTEVDLLIVSRNPDLLSLNHQAKKAVLWCHDLATYKGFVPKIMNVAWNIDEVWCVSEYHRQQIHDVTGYPLNFIKATRNGIVKFDDLLPVTRVDRSLLYSARPERGLENLVRKGGIMERLPEFTLQVTMYENFPEHMMEYYRYLWQRCEELPNVEMVGAKTQMQLRQMMRGAWAYVYPTAFEEVSCILAREAIEQHLPFITTRVGALPETLGESGIFYDFARPEIGTDAFCEGFADFIRDIYNGYEAVCNPEETSKSILDVANKSWFTSQEASDKRKDLYWDGVAEQWDSWSEPVKASDYSIIHSLIHDSDVIPAMEYFKSLPSDVKSSPGMMHLSKEMYVQYPFLFGDCTLAEYYKRIYEHEDEKKVPERQGMRTLKGTPRYNSIAEHIRHFPEGARILDYGCAEGPIILQLAQDFPDKLFFGVDFVESNIELCKKYAKEHSIKNVEFAVGSVDNWPEEFEGFSGAIISEVLEHVERPWEVATNIERHCEIGGKVIITVPQGPWEWNGLLNLEQWNWRAHIWHIDKWMIRTMFADKEGCTLANITSGHTKEGRTLGHLVMSYEIDHADAIAIDPVEKAKRHRSRQTVAACMISMNDEESILRTLNSIKDDVTQIKIALGPSTDHTREYIETWASQHPWIQVMIADVPAIKANEFGFDDARNESIKDIDADWVLWIDSDEYLSGENLSIFCRNNCFDSYAIHQHHFTCDPRGEPAQIDKPARLFRNRRDFKFFGKVHEHAEMGFNGGPGFVMVLPNIDIGHTGYVNEMVRRERFDRNFPLLEWDQKVYPERRLGKYLWLRDMIHRVRLLAQSKRPTEARQLAQEAINFFKEHQDSFDGVGAGSIAGNNALAYYSEAMAFLGKGHEITISMQMDGQQTAYTGIFSSAEEAMALGKKALEAELKKRDSGYWQ